MRRMGIGLQLYTLRDETAVDFAGTLRKVAELGYEGVEFAGYGGLSAAEMQELLQETGLQAVGSHVGLDRLREDLQGEIDYLKAISPTFPAQQYRSYVYATIGLCRLANPGQRLYFMALSFLLSFATFPHNLILYGAHLSRAIGRRLTRA